MKSSPGRGRDLDPDRGSVRKPAGRLAGNAGVLGKFRFIAGTMAPDMD